MAWSVDTDDFLGVCGDGRFPLLRAVNRALYRKSRGLDGAAPGLGSGCRVGVVLPLVSAVLYREILTS
jgi:hypothetical protein